MVAGPEPASTRPMTWTVSPSSDSSAVAVATLETTRAMPMPPLNTRSISSGATLALAGAAAAQIPSAPDLAPSAPPPVNLPPAGSAANGSVVQRSGPDQGPTQTAPSLARSTAAGGSSVQEVIVTARRRNENVERVPVSITAFGSAQLASRNITSQADLQAAVPGLTVRATQSQNELNFSLRGQSVDAFTNSQPAVLSYVNDVQSEVTSAASFFDLDSIQVLKGPQGTLFGRNATGGAVLYTTAKPGNDLSGYITGRLGNFDLREVQGALNLPAVSDVLLGRVAFDVDHQDGYIHNVTTGIDQGAVERQSFRGSLLFKPTSKLESITVVEYDHSGGNNTGLDLYSAPPVGTTNHGLNLSTVSALYSPLLDTVVGVPGAFASFIAAHPGANPGGYQAALAQEKALGPFSTISESPTYHREHDWAGSNTTTYQITPDLLVKNILGFENVVQNDFTDIVGAPYPVENQINPNNGEQGFNRDASQGSEEFQIQGKAFDHQLNFIVGTYYGYEKVISVDNIAVFDITPIIQPEGFTYHFEEPDYTEALFFQGTYDLSRLTGVQGLSLTGGFRYTWEQLHFKQFDDSILFNGSGTEKSDYSDPSWTDGVEYQFTPTTLFYLENRGSWRTGGFNGTAPDMDTTAANLGNVFLPETTYDVEGGMKYSGELFGRPTRLNLAAYNQWVSNVQRLVVIEVGAIPVGLTTNVP